MVLPRFKITAAVVASCLVGVVSSFATFSLFNGLLKEKTFEARQSFVELAVCRCSDGLESQSCRSDRFVSVTGIEDFSVEDGANTKADEDENVFTGIIASGEGGPATLKFRFSSPGLPYFILFAKVVLFVLPFAVLMPLLLEWRRKKNEAPAQSDEKNVHGDPACNLEIFGESVSRPFLLIDENLKVVHANCHALSQSPTIVGRHVIDWSKEAFELAEEVFVLKKVYARSSGFEMIKIGEVRYALLKQI